MTSDMTQGAATDVTSPTYGFGLTLNLTVVEAIARVTEALKTEGFGILTTIDVQATLKAKLGIEQAPYVILGACNPQLAHRAITADPNVGLLLPCNVVVRALPDLAGQPQSRVEVADPISMMSIVQNPDLTSVATEARSKLEHVVASLA